jgi:phospholipid/cholesterol/gamma-HCH transport system substrate-binding protein
MKRLLDLLNAHSGEFNVSVIVPIEHESFDKEVNHNRVKVAIKEAGEKILTLRPDYDFLVGKAAALFDQIDWEHPAKGVGLFFSPSVSEWIYFTQPVTEKIIAGELFETRDIVYEITNTMRFWLLVISMNRTRLFRGEGNKIHEMQDERFPLHYVEEFDFDQTPSRIRSTQGVEKSRVQMERSMLYIRKVEAVQLISDSTVRIDMRIREEKRSFIRKDAVASIASDGLMGDKIINIVSGKEKRPVVENHDVIRSTNPMNMDAMIKTLTETNDNISVITANLRQLTTEMNASKGVLYALIKDTLMLKDLQQSFRNIEQATAQLNSVGGNLQQVMSDVRRGRNSVGAVLQDTGLAQNLSHSIQQIKATSDQLLSASNQLSAAAVKINSGHGTVNKMLSDSVMAADVEQSIKNIRQATITLKEDLEALQHSSLLKGYFKKQEKEAAKYK